MNNKKLSLSVATIMLGSVLTYAQDQPTLPTKPQPPQLPAEGGGGGSSSSQGAKAAQVHMAQAAVNSARASVNQKLFGLNENRVGKSALFIGVSNPDPTKIADNEEDMTVMSKILEKAASGRNDRAERAMGIFIRMPGVPAQNNLYIQGHGALFFLEVNYPLVQPSLKKDTEESRTENNNEWEETKRELAHPEDSFKEFSWEMNEQVLPGEEYNREKVEDLKQRILTALANANHLRQVGSDEFVTVVVTGRSPAAGSKKSGKRVGPSKSSVTASAEDRATHLIFRAKKSDIESFAKEKLSFDAFNQKVKLAAY